MTLFHTEKEISQNWRVQRKYPMINVNQRRLAISVPKLATGKHLVCEFSGCNNGYLPNILSNQQNKCVHMNQM